MKWLSFLMGIVIYLLGMPVCAQQSTRIWVDTDAACGVSAFKDVDDCIALAALAQANASRIAGISSTFGNVPRPRVDAVLTKLMPLWRTQFVSPRTIYVGARRVGDCDNNQASTALRNALRRERLIILVLGPFTNLSCVLQTDPNIAGRIERIIAVAGARPGHVFHPAEGASQAMLFGHGPVARDLNVAKDKQAAADVLATDIPITLTPYDVAKEVEVRPPDLARLSRTGPLGQAIADMTQPWLATWKKYIGRDGFYPFDLMAVAAILKPEAFICQRENAQVRVDQAINNSRFGPKRLLIGGSTGRSVTWCNALARGGDTKVLGLLGPSNS